MIHTAEELRRARTEAQEAFDACQCRILVCSGTGCIATGSEKIYQKFLTLTRNDHSVVLEFAPHEGVHHAGVKKTGCQGICELGPLVRIQKGDRCVQYTKVQIDDCDEIYAASVQGDAIWALCLRIIRGIRKSWIPSARSRDSNRWVLKLKRSVRKRLRSWRQKFKAAKDPCCGSRNGIKLPPTPPASGVGGCGFTASDTLTDRSPA